MKEDFHVIIPARYHSTRLPGKLLMELHGKTVLERVYRQVLKAAPASVTIATDHPSIASEAQGFGARVEMTDADHPSGTDRLAEIVCKGSFSSDEIIVNVQGDEPFIHPALIKQVAAALGKDSEAKVATLCWPIETKEQFLNPNVVKVVKNKNERALYFSRAPIPAQAQSSAMIAQAFRHIGLYAYRASFLSTYTDILISPLEKAETLEQLRVLWAGYTIRVEEAEYPPGQDINTFEDLLSARRQDVLLDA